MKLETFAMERLQSMWENRVAWNVSESGVHPLRVDELVDDPASIAALLTQELGYPQTNGTVELRSAIAAMYPGATRITSRSPTAAPRPTALLLMRLVEPGDEIVLMTPNYMQAPGLARGLGATVTAVAARREPARGGRPTSTRSQRWSRRRHEARS